MELYTEKRERFGLRCVSVHMCVGFFLFSACWMQSNRKWCHWTFHESSRCAFARQSTRTRNFHERDSSEAKSRSAELGFISPVIRIKSSIQPEFMSERKITFLHNSLPPHQHTQGLLSIEHTHIVKRQKRRHFGPADFTIYSLFCPSAGSPRWSQRSRSLTVDRSNDSSAFGHIRCGMMAIFGEKSTCRSQWNMKKLIKRCWLCESFVHDTHGGGAMSGRAA